MSNSKPKKFYQFFDENADILIKKTRKYLQEKEREKGIVRIINVSEVLRFLFTNLPSKLAEEIQAQKI